MVKKKTNKKSLKKIQYRKEHYIFGALILVIALAAISVLAYQAVQFLNTQQDRQRLERIEAIYSTIPTPEQTYFYEEDIFGDKRPYDYDSGRSKSSEKTFVVAARVDETFARFDTLIKDAGYTPIGDPYPGSLQPQRHYKTDKGEYIRLSVSSKLRDDAGSSEILMKGEFSEDFFKIDPNAGPSRVTIKVNLDDNNE